MLQNVGWSVARISATPVQKIAYTLLTLAALSGVLLSAQVRPDSTAHSGDVTPVYSPSNVDDSQAAETIYRPTTFSSVSGWVPYTNPQLAFDGNPSTAATAGVESHDTPIGAKEVWSGFPRISGKVTSVVLSIEWSGACGGSGACADGVSYTAAGGVSGHTTNLPNTETIDNFVLPANVDLTTLQVTGGINVVGGEFGPEIGSQKLYEIYVTTQ